MILISNRGDVSISFPANSKVLPGGEVHPYVDPAVATWSAVNLTAFLKDGTDIMDLVMVTDAIRRLNPAIQIHLWMPYLPYARQDRVPRPGESLTIKPFCDIINLQGYATVSVLDVHSDVGLALLDRVRHVSLPQVVAKAMTRRNEANTGAWTNTVLIAPDAGAMKKTLELARLVGCPHVVCGFKDRDTATGKITGTRVDINFEPRPGMNWLVVDDICDGGYTFVELAKALSEKLTPILGEGNAQYATKGYSLELWVTHGLFTKGFEELKRHYSRIETTNSWHPTGLYSQRPDGVTDQSYYWHSVQGIFA
ncbi:Ribose-phosphate pyrophosphokinase 2 [compost metagenome]